MNAKRVIAVAVIACLLLIVEGQAENANKVIRSIKVKTN